MSTLKFRKIVYVVLITLICVMHLFNSLSSLSMNKKKPSLAFRKSKANAISELKELLKILEITTFLEGEIDPDDKIKLTTRIVDHQNGETTYLTPSFENIDGKFRYSQSLLQQDGEDKYTISGSAKSDVEGIGNLGLHAQQFDLETEQKNKKLFTKYARYLKKYIDYLYKYNMDLDSDYLKDLERNFVYYGSLSNGDNPSLETNFQMTNLKEMGSRSRNYETMAGSQGAQDSSISYGLSNLTGNEDAHNFQNMISTAAGKAPISGLQLKAHENGDYIRGSIVGQAISKPSEGVSMTTIDTIGENEAYGFSDHSSYSEQDKETLATVSEINNLSVSSSKINPKFVKMHDKYFGNKTDNDEKPEINTKALSDKMEKIGSHAKNEINGDINNNKESTKDFVESDPLYQNIGKLNAYFNYKETIDIPDEIEDSKSLKKLQDFIKSQQRTPLIAPEKIDPETLKNKIHHLSKNNIERNKNKNQKGHIDGSVALNGTPTIRSIKKLNKNNIFKFKMKKSKNNFTQKNNNLLSSKNHLSTSYVYIPKKPVQIVGSTENIIPKNG